MLWIAFKFCSFVIDNNELTVPKEFVPETKTTLNAPNGLFGKYPEINTLAFKRMKVTELREFTLEFYRLFLKGKKKEIEKEFSEEEKDILGIFDDEKKKEKDDVMLLDIDDIIEEEPIKASGIPGAVPINIVEDDETFLERDRPKPDDYNLDIEKELENKFDELFGSLEWGKNEK